MGPKKLVQTMHSLTMMTSGFLKVESNHQNTCMHKVMLCFSYSLGQKVILQFLISQLLIYPYFCPGSVTSFQLKMLSSQDQMKSLGSFHNLLLIIWIILSIFFCTFCLTTFICPNCSQFLAKEYYT